MARPSRQYGQITPRTPAELRVIRQRGHRDFKAALLQSEEKGKTPEVANIPTETAKTPEVISISEEKEIGTAPEVASIPEEIMHDNE